MLLNAIIITTMLFNFQSIGDEPWKKLVLNDEVSVEFPSLPIKKNIDDNEMYFYKSNEYAIMVVASKTAYPKYKAKLKKKFLDQTEFTNSFLNAVVDDKLSSDNIFDVSVKSLEIGDCIGREVNYVSAGKGNMNKQNRFTILIMVKESLYTFEFWYLKGVANTDDKRRFFNSIFINVESR